MSYPQPQPSPNVDLNEFVGECRNIAVRSVWLDRHQVVSQHQHPDPHVTFVTSGSVRMWANEVWSGDYKAPELINVKAGVIHMFQALEDRTHMACLFVTEKS